MTHINAYYLDVQEKQQAVDTAQAELESAKVRLQNHPDYVAPKKTEDKPRTVTRSANNGKFVKKDEAKKNPATNRSDCFGRFFAFLKMCYHSGYDYTRSH